MQVPLQLPCYDFITVTFVYLIIFQKKREFYFFLIEKKLRSILI